MKLSFYISSFKILTPTPVGVRISEDVPYPARFQYPKAFEYPNIFQYPKISGTRPKKIEITRPDRTWKNVLLAHP